MSHLTKKKWGKNSTIFWYLNFHGNFFCNFFFQYLNLGAKNSKNWILILARNFKCFCIVKINIVGNSRNIWIISFAGRIIDDFGKCKIKCKWRGESSFSARFRISSSKAKTTWYFKWRGWLGPCWSYYALRSHPSENCRDDTPLYYRGTIKAFASENIKKKNDLLFCKAHACASTSVFGLYLLPALLLMFFEVISHPDFFHQDLVFSHPPTTRFLRIFF